MTTGAAIGVVLAAGYLLQTWGLKHTTATNAGLITGLFVVLAPIADRLLFGAVLRWSAWASVAISLFGMTLLTGRPPTHLALGDLLVLGCAVAFGVHIALLSRFAPRHDPRALTAAQMLSTAVCFLLLWPLVGRLEPPPREVWFALVLTGLVASTVAYGIQTWAQRHLSTARTAVVLTTEPLFAAIFGFALAGERLGSTQLVGAALILAAVVLSEAIPAIRKDRQASG
jgi:drug/metabolite transporter (DMT)-like permease